MLRPPFVWVARTNTKTYKFILQVLLNEAPESKLDLEQPPHFRCERCSFYLFIQNRLSA
jgi:hypothetical protein